MSEQRQQVDTARDEQTPADLLSRWSRRKQAVRQGLSVEAEPEFDEVPVTDEHEQVAEPDPEERIDPRTGKRFAELTDGDMPDITSLTGDSDLSVFMAKNITPALRMKALARVFHSAKYNKICLCAEYAEDYTNFEPLGDVIPHDLKASIAREAKKLRDRLLGDGEEISAEDAEARIWRETKHRRSGEDVPREELAEGRWRDSVDVAEPDPEADADDAQPETVRTVADDGKGET